MRKGEIRKEVLKARLALPAEEVDEKSANILKRLLALEEYRRAAVLMTYVDFRNEVRTGDLIRESLARGKRVAVPFTDPRDRRLIPSLLLNFPEDLAPGTWGILEPAPGCLRPVKPAEIDLVVVPGVAFDEKGNRLGYGGGYYDRFLPQTRPGCFHVAPAFELQIRPELTPDPYDCPVHCLVTEKRVIYVKKSRKTCPEEEKSR
ncbi:MAG: 5-formyltetrahydrofolate cyclo-ligase [Bacillota bacterium]